MRLNIDLDGVVCDFVGKFQAFVEGELSKTLPSTTHYEMWLDWDISKAQFYKFLDSFIMLSGFRHLMPIPHAISTLQRLVKKHKIQIVTSRGTSTNSQINRLWKASTIDWLFNYQVPYHSLIFTQDKAQVPGILLDDCTRNLIKYPCPVCFDRPWNQDFIGDRVRGWWEFEEYVLHIEDLA